MIRVNRPVYVVTESKQSENLLYLSFRFNDAKAFTMTHNKICQTGRTVIRPGTAHIDYDGERMCPFASTSSTEAATDS